MERHPVPQNIMDVEFKLFGALTIKQFAYAAGGFVVALLFYFSGFPDLVKWIFIGISILGGLFLSVMKINGQPSTVWVSNFVLSMFEPQERLWRKTPVIPDILKEDKTGQSKSVDALDSIISRRKLESMPVLPLANTEIPESEKKLIAEEDSSLKEIDQHFDFLFNELPQVATTSVNPDIKAQEKPMANPIVAKADSLASGIAASRNIGDTIYQGKDYAVTFKPMNNQVSRPLQSTFKKEAELTANNYVKGTIVSSTGAAVTGANIYLLDKSGKIIRNSVSQANGAFAVTSGLTAGDYLLDIKKEGFKFPRYSVSLKGDKVLELKLQSL